MDMKFCTIFGDTKILPFDVMTAYSRDFPPYSFFWIVRQLCAAGF